MSLTDPLYLLLFIPAYLWLFVVARQMHGIAAARKRIAVGLRALILAALILALAGLQSNSVNKGVATVFVLDHSASVTGPANDADESFIRSSLASLHQNDQAGLVVFGKDPVIDVDTGSLRSLGKIYSNPDPSATDIAAAIRLASATFPSGTAKRLVILSDGNETDGDAAAAASAADSDNIQIDYVPPLAPNPNAGEVVLRDLIVPSQVTRNEPFEIRAIVDSTQPTSGTIRLDRDGTPAATMPVNLLRGTNSIVLGQTVGQPGLYRYRAVIDAADDTDVRNNEGMGFVDVRGRPRVLLLEGVPGSAAALAQALKAYDLDVVTAGAEGLPDKQEDLQSFDSVIFSDLSADSVTDRQMELIASAVHDSGIGFGMVGGENSFLPGGYYGTKLADVLPVDMNIRERKTFPSTTMLIVVDTSGSMGMMEDGVMKVKIAASAAAATVRLLQPTDYVGVAGSTDEIAFVAPIQLDVDKDNICDEVGTLGVGGGGIYIEPSLLFAEKNLLKQNTRVKHLLLLSDGDDAETQEGAYATAQKMVGEGMTVSTVAVGDGKDVGFLRNLSVVGRGSFYLARRTHQLQALMTRDTAIMSRSAIEDGVFIPKVDPADEVLQGLNLKQMPPLYAYCLTSDRPLARTPMRTNKDDPLLSFWQYGVGTSMAFTSDAQPKWARQWMGWPDFNAFWSQVVRSTLRQTSNNRLQVTTHRSGDEAVVDIEAYDTSGNPINNLAAMVNVSGPDGQTISVPISQQGPGHYTGQFDASSVGGYVVNVAEAAAAGGKPSITSAGYAVAYPPEYQTFGPNTGLLDQMARTTGGVALTDPAQAFRPSNKPGRSIRDLWPQLLLIAAILFPMDVALRRLALPFAEIQLAIVTFLRRVFRRRHASRTVSRQAQTFSRLQQAKHRPVGSDRVQEPLSLDPRPDVPKSESDSPAPVSKSPRESSSPVSTAQRLLDIKRNRDGKSD